MSIGMESSLIYIQGIFILPHKANIPPGLVSWSVSGLHDDFFISDILDPTTYHQG